MEQEGKVLYQLVRSNLTHGQATVNTIQMKILRAHTVMVENRQETLYELENRKWAITKDGITVPLDSDLADVLLSQKAL